MAEPEAIGPPLDAELKTLPPSARRARVRYIQPDERLRERLLPELRRLLSEVEVNASIWRPRRCAGDC